MAERINMAEGIGPRPEGPPQGQQPTLDSSTRPVGVEGQNLPPASGEPSPQRPWHISPEYDPKRAGEYVTGQEGGYTVFTDPTTGREMAKLRRIAGGDDEVPQSPEPPRGPEWEASPERGREIVNEIVRLETTLGYTERYGVRTGLLSTTNPEIYSERNGTYLDQLYKDLQDYTRAVRRVRNVRDEKDPWNLINAYKKIKEALERIAGGESPAVAQQTGTGQVKERGKRPSVLPTDSLIVLFEKYAGTNVDAVEGDLATYFQEARALGLLDRADAIFISTYRQIIQGNIPGDQVEEVLERNTELARRAIEGVCRARRTDPNVARLRGIAEAYTKRTADIFQLTLMDEAYTQIEGEFKFDAGEFDDEDTRLYWEPGHWPKTYEISAQNKGQFRRAMDSFISKKTGGAFGKSPDELYEHFNNFTEKFTQTASSRGMEDEFVKESRLELQGHGFVFGGDYSFETYNMKSANQFLMAMALHEGPQRWVRLARSGNGAVGAYLRKFDYDPRITLLHNPGGSRGQLLHDTVTQHYLHQQIRDILVEKGMGVVLKDYDPRDTDSAASLAHSIKITTIGDAEVQRDKFLKANLERIGIHQTVEEFKGLYEGFDTGDTHIVNYRKYGSLTEEVLKQFSPRLRRSVIIGKVQDMLQSHKIAGRDRDELFKKVDELKEKELITDKERKIWKDAYDQSKASFNVAFQMVGATGEKARRGGGVFFIDRKDENGHRLFVDNMPVYLGEMFIQYAENRTKIEYSDDSKVWDEGSLSEFFKKNKYYIEITKEDGKKEKLLTKAAYRTYMVGKARTQAINQIKTNGFEAKLAFPKLLFNTDENSPNFGEVIGLDGDQTETVDFGTATDPENPLNKWLNHTYLSYQPENRHQVTNPDVLRAAKRRRIRLLRPDLMRDQPESEYEQHENLADLRLILDPTLNRIASLKDSDMPEGMSAQQAEILLSDGAVEASNQGHWRIVRELNAAFMDPEGNPFKMRTGYNLEDYSGIARFIIRMRQFVASNPKRFARRYAAEIANLPLNVSSMPDQWGQAGVLGAIEMFADPVGKMAEQREASQFAITKWVEQMRIGNMIYGALVGQVDPERGFSIEGLFEKPTNNSDKLVKYWEQLAKIKKYPDAENEFFYALVESFDRLWVVLKLVRTMESDTRNAQGALDLEKTDVFLADGKVNPAIVLDRNTGSSRHTERIFFNKYIDWLLSDKPGGGQATYPSEVAFYKFLREKYFYFDGKKQINDPDGRTWADWLFDKMGR